MFNSSAQKNKDKVKPFKIPYDTFAIRYELDLIKVLFTKTSSQLHDQKKTNELMYVTESETKRTNFSLGGRVGRRDGWEVGIDLSHYYI